VLARSLAAKANGTAIQTPDPTFSQATRDSTGQPPGAAAVRIHLVQLAGQPAPLTDTLRAAGRLDYRWNTRTAQGAAQVLDASHDRPAEFVQAGRLDPGDGRRRDGEVIAHCPPS
jgi:hypothetical protein